MRFLRNLADAVLTTLVGIDLRPMLEELRSMLDDVPCSHCGLSDHSMLTTDEQWLNARELGTFGGAR